MVINNKGKVIQISKQEYEDIKNIYNNSTCIKCATNKLDEYLINKCVELTTQNVHNLLLAVIENYKYLKIK